MMTSEPPWRKGYKISGLQFADRTVALLSKDRRYYRDPVNRCISRQSQLLAEHVRIYFAIAKIAVELHHGLA